MYFILKNEDIDIKFIKGIGPRNKTLLQKKNIHNIYDLLSFFPRDYEDRRKILKIAQINPNLDTINIKGKIIDFVESRKGHNFYILDLIVKDETGVLTVKFFNQTYLREIISIGKIVYFSGKIEYSFGKLYMNNPDWVLEEKEEKLKLNFKRIVPIYSLTEGLSQSKMRTFIFNALTKVRNEIIDPLPNEIVKKFNLVEEKYAIIRTHFPKLDENYYKVKNFETKYQKRLIFDEVFFLNFLWKKRKKEIETQKGYSFELKRDELINFIINLPFKLTKAQERVLEEILGDMAKSVPMNRLLQGDVGSGKTVVSLIAMLNVFFNGFQSVIMVPTEVLAQQHFKKIKNFLNKMDINIGILYGKMKKSEMRTVKEKIKSGELDIIVGTHALFQEDVEFKKLGFVVIDEQHRFGVKQRMELIGKGIRPDVLVMSATPIPRSIAQTVYGDMDYSIIDEMPAGRQKIETIIINEKNTIYEYIKETLQRKEQVYVVYPLIEETEKLDWESANKGYDELSQIFGEKNVGILHGKLKSNEKLNIMEQFQKGIIKILVSTTVIEVGIDVPNATLMIIMNSERFGLSQLHQLRGRVGRSDKKSMCILYSESKDNPRLNIMVNYNDGFKIALEDFKLRGPGDILGTLQSGFPMFKLFNPFLHRDMVQKAKDVVDFIYNKYNKNLEHRDLAIINKILNKIYGNGEFLEVL